MKKSVVYLWGGSGKGKTTHMFGITYHLKLRGILADCTPEWVKYKRAYQKLPIHPGDQTYIFAKQAQLEKELIRAGVQAIISDSPLMLGHFYGSAYDKYEQQFNMIPKLWEQHNALLNDNGYQALHYLVGKPVGRAFEERGRYETEEESDANHEDIGKMLDKFKIPYNPLGRNIKENVKLIVSNLTGEPCIKTSSLESSPSRWWDLLGRK